MAFIAALSCRGHVQTGWNRNVMGIVYLKKPKKNPETALLKNATERHYQPIRNCNIVTYTV